MTEWRSPGRIAPGRVFWRAPYWRGRCQVCGQGANFPSWLEALHGTLLHLDFHAIEQAVAHEVIPAIDRAVLGDRA